MRLQKQFVAVALALMCVGPVCAQSVARVDVIATYAAIASASYDDSLASAKVMQRAIDAFLARPAAETLAAAKKSWLAAREWYGQTEVFRFYGGPIDGADGPEPRINSWPIDEAYIDSVKGKPDAGIVNNAKVPITKRQLASLNARDGQ